MSNAADSTPCGPAIVPLLMSGGSGTRLWPVSTEARPKQLHALTSGATMLQETIRRLRPDPTLQLLPPILICNRRHEALVRDQVRASGVEPSLIVLEPFGRSTAAVAAMAAELTAAKYPGAFVLLLPADHVMYRPENFRAAVRRAATAVDRIVAFGIRPRSAHTGYGYIQSGAPVGEDLFEVAMFREKPDRRAAEAYLADGGYHWNSGILLFKPKVMLEEIGRYRPAILAAVRRALAAAGPAQDGVIRLPDAEFAVVPSEAVDKAVMELTRRAAVAPCDPGWADVGSWLEYWRAVPQDERGNVLRGEAVAPDTSGSVVWSETLPVAVLGMKDVIVVVSGDGVLVAPRERSEEVKAAVEQLRARVGGVHDGDVPERPS